MFANIKQSYKFELPPDNYCHSRLPGLSRESLVLEFLDSSFGSLNLIAAKDRIQLFRAAANGNLEVVNTMLKDGSNVDGRKGTVANFAGMLGKHVIYREFVKNEPSFNLTTLHFAIANDHLEVAKLLVEKGADVKAGDDDGFQPMHLAAASGNIEIVDLLLRRGAGVNATSIKGVTPLHLAAQEGHLDMVTHLMVRGADTNSKTLSLEFKEENDHEGLWPVCVENWTPLHFAIHKERYDVVKKLLLVGIALENDYIDPLDLAERGFFQKVVEFLTSIDVSIESNKVQQLFELAIQKESLESVKILVGRGININAKFDGKTPLHRIIERSFYDTVNLEIMKVLLQNGADPNSKDFNEHTPLDYAIIDGAVAWVFKQKDIESVFCLLLEKGCSENTILGCLSLELGAAVVVPQHFKPIIHHYLAEQPGKKKPACLSDGRCKGYQARRYWDECIAEQEKMKEKYFDHNLSLYSIFAEKDLNITCLRAKNEKIVQYCKSDDCKQNYPLYVDLILKKLKQGEERVELIDKLDKLKISVEGSEAITLGQDCQRHVASFLSNNDLRSLVKAAEDDIVAAGAP